MKNFKINFDSKSTSPKIKKAVEIARKMNFTESDNSITVEVTEITQDLKDLLDIVAHLTKTELFIDEIAVDSKGYLLRQILNCHKLKSCKGKCTLCSYEWDEIISVIGLSKSKVYYDEEEEFDELIFDNFGKKILIEVSDNSFTIDRDELIKAYHKNFELSRLLCPKYTKSSYLSRIEKFEKHHTITMEISEESKFTSMDDKELQEHYEKERLDDQNKLVNKIGDEVEKRLLKVLNQFLNERKI